MSTTSQQAIRQAAESFKSTQKLGQMFTAFMGSTGTSSDHKAMQPISEAIQLLESDPEKAIAKLKEAITLLGPKTLPEFDKKVIAERKVNKLMAFADARKKGIAQAFARNMHTAGWAKVSTFSETGEEKWFLKSKGYHLIKQGNFFKVLNGSLEVQAKTDLSMLETYLQTLK